MTTHEGHYRFACEPAATVVRALGGVRRAAQLIGVSAETCSQWNRPADRRGTGGFVPPRFWATILSVAKIERASEITEGLLAGGKKERPDVGSMSRRKGALFELQVAKDLKALGFDTRKIPLSGAAVGYPGDVEVLDTPTGRWVLQCKIAAGTGGRHSVLRMLHQVVVGKVRAAGKDLVAMRMTQFAQVLRGEKIQVVNMPAIAVPGKIILDHLKGHDALVFRRSGSTEWMAIVAAERFGK